MVLEYIKLHIRIIQVSGESSELDPWFIVKSYFSHVCEGDIIFENMLLNYFTNLDGFHRTQAS